MANALTLWKPFAIYYHRVVVNGVTLCQYVGKPLRVAMENEPRQNDESMWEVGDVATYLKVSENTIRAWVFNDSIPFHKVGRLVRFRREEIDTWVSAGREPKVDEAGAA